MSSGEVGSWCVKAVSGSVGQGDLNCRPAVTGHLADPAGYDTAPARKLLPRDASGL